MFLHCMNDAPMLLTRRANDPEKHERRAERNMTPLSLLIAADANLQATLVEQIDASENLRAIGAGTAAEALVKIQTLAFDAVLVSCDLPAAGGNNSGAVELRRNARDAGLEAPLILLAHATESKEVQVGFDAVLLLPFRFSRLLAELDALPRPPHVNRSALAFDDCDALTEKELAILQRLAQAKGEAVDRKVLLREIWGYNSSVATHTLETHIHRLRVKLGKSGGFNSVVTAPGGYRLERITTERDPCG